MRSLIEAVVSKSLKKWYATAMRGLVRDISPRLGRRAHVGGYALVWLPRESGAAPEVASDTRSAYDEPLPSASD